MNPLSLTSGKRFPGILFALTLCAISCDSAVGASHPRVASIVLDPSALVLTPGVARALSATITDDQGNPLPNAGIHWATGNPAVATISAQGVVTAVAVGATQVAASKEGRSAIAAIEVSALPPALVRVTPTTSTILVGGRVTLTPEVLDAGGGTLSGHPVAWSSGNPATATVNARGVVIGVAEGSVVIAASTAGLTGTAVVTVRLVPVATVNVVPAKLTISVGQTQQLTVSLLDAAGRLLTGRRITWSSADPSIATVSAGGLVRGRGKGTTVITTTSEGKSATASVSVP
jgi:uncharacterized protein YjdB